MSASIVYIILSCISVFYLSIFVCILCRPTYFYLLPFRRNKRWWWWWWWWFNWNARRLNGNATRLGDSFWCMVYMHVTLINCSVYTM